MPKCNVGYFDSRILQFKFVLFFEFELFRKTISFVTVTKMKLLIDDVNEN